MSQYSPDKSTCWLQLPIFLRFIFWPKLSVIPPRWQRVYRERYGEREPARGKVKQISWEIIRQYAVCCKSANDCDGREEFLSGSSGFQICHHCPHRFSAVRTVFTFDRIDDGMTAVTAISRRLNRQNLSSFFYFGTNIQIRLVSSGKG